MKKNKQNLLQLFLCLVLCVATVDAFAMRGTIKAIVQVVRHPIKSLAHPIALIENSFKGQEKRKEILGRLTRLEKTTERQNYINIEKLKILVRELTEQPLDFMYNLISNKQLSDEQLVIITPNQVKNLFILNKVELLQPSQSTNGECFSVVEVLNLDNTLLIDEGILNEAVIELAVAKLLTLEQLAQLSKVNSINLKRLLAQQLLTLTPEFKSQDIVIIKKVLEYKNYISNLDVQNTHYSMEQAHELSASLLKAVTDNLTKLINETNSNPAVLAQLHEYIKSFLMSAVMLSANEWMIVTLFEKINGLTDITMLLDVYTLIDIKQLLINGLNIYPSKIQFIFRKIFDIENLTTQKMVINKIDITQLMLAAIKLRPHVIQDIFNEIRDSKQEVFEYILDQLDINMILLTAIKQQQPEVVQVIVSNTMTNNNNISKTINEINIYKILMSMIDQLSKNTINQQQFDAITRIVFEGVIWLGGGVAYNDVEKKLIDEAHIDQILITAINNKQFGVIETILNSVNDFNIENKLYTDNTNIIKLYILEQANIKQLLITAAEQQQLNLNAIQAIFKGIKCIKSEYLRAYAYNTAGIKQLLNDLIKNEKHEMARIIFECIDYSGEMQNFINYLDSFEKQQVVSVHIKPLKTQVVRRPIKSLVHPITLIRNSFGDQDKNSVQLIELKQTNLSQIQFDQEVELQSEIIVDANEMPFQKAEQINDQKK